MIPSIKATYINDLYIFSFHFFLIKIKKYVKVLVDISQFIFFGF